MKKAAEPSYNWKLVHGNPDKDHSFWLDRNSGRISIKDESGDLPHQTDDGVLWLDTNRPLVVEKYDGKTYIGIPLQTTWGEDAQSSTSLEKAIRLAERFHMSIIFNNVLPPAGESTVEASRKDGNLIISFI